jgi:WxL domain surface cell wall-binding
MKNLLRSRQLFAGVASLGLIGGMAGASIALSSEPAGATACGTSNISTCTATGTLTVTPGNLTFTTPATLAWTSLLTGAAQSAVDTRPGDQVATVNDASGTQAGWRVSITATTFTNSAFTTNNTLPDSGTFSLTGSVTSATSSTQPSITCVVVGTCTIPVPGGAITWPLQIPTSPTGTTTTVVGDAIPGTGVGNVQLGGSTSAAPLGWWLNIPATALSGSYVSNLTATISSGP